MVKVFCSHKEVFLEGTTKEENNEFSQHFFLDFQTNITAGNQSFICLLNEH